MDQYSTLLALEHASKLNVDYVDVRLENHQSELITIRTASFGEESSIADVE